MSNSAGSGGEWRAELDPALTDLQELLDLQRELARAIADMKAAVGRDKCKFFQPVIDATNRRDDAMRAIAARCRPARPPKPRAWERAVGRNERSTA